LSKYPGGAGYLLKAEVSIYPADDDNDTFVFDSLEVLEENNLQYDVDRNIESVHTELMGTDTEVWTGLQSLFAQANASAEDVVMVITLTRTSLGKMGF